jgi:hypothetical protein
MTNTITHTVIAANPGWSLAIFIKGGKDRNGEQYEAGFAHEDIIAWDVEIRSGPYHRARPGDEMCVSRYATPITAESTDTEHLGNRWALRSPAGVYFIPGDRVLGTEAEAVAELLADAKTEAAA